MRLIGGTGAIVLVALMVGCGGSDVDDTGTTDPLLDQETVDSAASGEEAVARSGDLIQAVTAQFEALLVKDDEIYFDLLSNACRERLGFAAVAGHLDGRHFRAGLDGVDMSLLSVADVLVDGGRDTATVRLVIDGPNGDKFQETFPHQWIYQDGRWLMDDCADFSEAQGGLEGVGMDRNDPLQYGGVADVYGWLVALTFLTPDAEDLIVETGGSPASEGSQLFTAQLNVGYNGAEPSIVYGDELAYAFVHGDTVYGDEADCIEPDNTLYVDPATEVGPGEDVGIPNVCREISTGHATGLLLRVTHIPTGGEWWFSLDGA